MFRRRLPLALLALALLAGAGLVAARAANPDALWHIVHDRCVPDQIANGTPAPCTEVDIKGGTALLKDQVGVAQFLLMPTAKVTGMEDAAILAPSAPNYFAAAWAARGHVSALLHRDLPDDATSLAINSEVGRTQNQLHIHIDCLRADIRTALAAHAASIGPAWAPVPGGLAGHPYQAMRLDDLSRNPFHVLADTLPGAAADMGHHTLVLVGAPDGSGFILLADRAHLPAGDFASGEELQDHACPAY
jgi:CDP-diacylglycerol pyrophosphatase